METAATVAATVMVGLVLLGGAMHIEQVSSQFAKGQTVDLTANRVVRAAQILEAVPTGHIQLPIEGHQFNYIESEDLVNVSIAGSYYQRPVEEATGYSEVVYEGEKEEVEDFVCLVKEGDQGKRLVFEVDSCGSR